jgi:uncharacterized UBP type Zn finger protein
MHLAVVPLTEIVCFATVLFNCSSDNALCFAGYKLMAFVSHMGTSTHCGHYVAHVLKNGRWAIFNDSKVAASVDLPKDMGYLYFFQRISG